MLFQSPFYLHASSTYTYTSNHIWSIYHGSNGHFLQYLDLSRDCLGFGIPSNGSGDGLGTGAGPVGQLPAYVHRPIQFNTKMP